VLNGNNVYAFFCSALGCERVKSVWNKITGVTLEMRDREGMIEKEKRQSKEKREAISARKVNKQEKKVNFIKSEDANLSMEEERGCDG